MLLTYNNLGEYISLCKFDKERITRYSMETFKREFAEYLAQTFILSNAPKEEGDQLWIELNKLVLPNIPQKLFRFRGCSKYSFADFKNGKITTLFYLLGVIKKCRGDCFLTMIINYRDLYH